MSDRGRDAGLFVAGLATVLVMVAVLVMVVVLVAAARAAREGASREWRESPSLRSVALKSAAKQGDAIRGSDTHVLLVPSAAGPVPTPTPMAFQGTLDAGLSHDVAVDGKLVAVAGSTATNTPAHVPTTGPFQAPPSNRATVQSGSSSVFANGKPVARDGDAAFTCNDPADLPNGTIAATGTVFVG